MNEGKPTKAKWWSRPRPSGDATDGDFELARPRGAQDAENGDFELARPSAAPADPARDDAGDYELDGPAARPAGPATDAGAAPHSTGTGAVPAPRTDAPEPPASPAGGPPATEAEGADSVAGAEADARAVPGVAEAWAPAPVAEGTDPAAAADAPAPAAPGADGPPVPAPVAERPKPLHEPDPYSTPPYGEPGPWAPAPPVQHPATTPAHGTLTPTPGMATPAHGTTAPAPLPPAAPLGTPVPDPAYADAPPPASSTPSHEGTGAPGASASGPWERYDPWAAAASAAPLQQTGAAVPSRDQRKRRAKRTLLVAVVLVAVVSGGVGGAVGAYLERHGGLGSVELPQAGKEPAERAPDSVAGIAARALPGVVTLHVSGADAAGTGTGFVLDGSGHILTNNHVVEPAGKGGEITVTFNSGDTAEATVVGRDSGYDLAVVRVKGVGGLTPMPLGNSDNVQVGDPVVAIGAPFDLAGTVTSGIISAKERPITAGGEEGDGSDVSYVDALQTDAPINPGNSGGPLLDSRGRVIGINSAIQSADGGGAESDRGQAGSIGLGFAIPINQGKRVAEELINTGRATHPVIGITLDMAYSGDGARVGTEGSDGGSPVVAGGPGAKAGIRSGDVITEVDGQRVHSGEELIVKIRAHRPGDRLELTVERDGRERDVSLVLGSSDGG
ncbi:trypsin-like peptidase domain-containing protein [Streptomyces sp. NPDC004783]|uniref:trypsin-like peptidase domain-containing protein n=1 Tax=Streptomyces sp. NPDC004783 TaxID=3154459 RepID=UPI0033A7242B